jgi:protein-S-isoprenylcysteine O-methyltransferase Ste14
MGDGVVTAVLAGGWALQAASWLAALRRAGRAAAAPGEWLRESAIRAAMLAVVVWALAAPLPPRPGALGPAALLLFLAGHVLAVAARRQLGAAWGAGVEPRPGSPRVRRGLYAAIGHPIYVGMVVATLAQWLVLRNLPSALLAAGTVVVTVVKAGLETRSLDRR